MCHQGLVQRRGSILHHLNIAYFSSWSMWKVRKDVNCSGAEWRRRPLGTKVVALLLNTHKETPALFTRPLEVVVPALWLSLSDHIHIGTHF